MRGMHNRNVCIIKWGDLSNFMMVTIPPFAEEANPDGFQVCHPVWYRPPPSSIPPATPKGGKGRKG